MSDLIDSNPLPDEDAEHEREEHSTWTMFFSMLLLIAGFLMAGAFLIEQTLAAKNEEGEPIFQLSKIVEKGKSLGSRPAAPEPSVTETNAVKPTALENIKKIVNIQPSEKVRWPRLRLTGFGTSTDGTEGFAIINGDLVHPGETAGKVTLVEVRAHDVIVEYKGERKPLMVEMPK